MPARDRFERARGLIPICAVALVICLALVTGCVDSGRQTPAATRKRVTFLHYFSDTLSGGIDDMVKAFNAQQSRYEIAVTPLEMEAFKTSIRKTLEAGNPPDLYSYWAGARVVSVLDKLQPIDDVWTSGSFDRLFSPMIVESACTYEGKKYLLPITQHLVCFFYNRSVFEKLSLKPPATWDEFLATCEAIKKAGIVPIALGSKAPWPAQFWFDYLLLRTAPFEYRQRLTRGEAHYTDPEVKRVCELWKQIVTSGYFNADATKIMWDTGANEMVYQGKAAMTLMGTWVIGSYCGEAHQWECGVDFDYFMFPTINNDVPPVALGPIDGLVIPKNALNPRGAKETIRLLAGAGNQAIMSRGSGAFAPNLTVASSTYCDLQERIRKDLEKCRSWAFNYDLAVPPAVADLGLEAFNEFLEFPELHEEIFRRLEQGMASDAAGEKR